MASFFTLWVLSITTINRFNSETMFHCAPRDQHRTMVPLVKCPVFGGWMLAISPFLVLRITLLCVWTEGRGRKLCFLQTTSTKDTNIRNMSEGFEMTLRGWNRDLCEKLSGFRLATLRVIRVVTNTALCNV